MASLLPFGNPTWMQYDHSVSHIHCTLSFRKQEGGGTKATIDLERRKG